MAYGSIQQKLTTTIKPWSAPQALLLRVKLQATLAHGMLAVMLGVKIIATANNETASRRTAICEHLIWADAHYQRYTC